jgi:UPF0755 protein
MSRVANEEIESMLKGIGAVAMLALVVSVAGWWWVDRALAPVHEGGGQVQPLAFEVEPGDSLGRVAHGLEEKGLIRSAKVTRWFAKAEDLSARIKVGEYELSATQSTPEILEVLARGRVRTHVVVIPEGQRASEIADRLAAAGLADRQAFLDVVLDPESAGRLGVEGSTLEGYLYPDTYRFARGLNPEQIVRTMVEEFLRVYAELDPAVGQAKLSMLELVTLASIVEKETGAAEERPLIAAVFLNRMKLGMRLETDPTVIYGIENFDGNLRRVHLQDDSNVYNTYRIRGLPPGPIASPGREALQAVRAPADTPYLYFVSRNDGTHLFSKTYADHKAAVDKFQRRRRKR